MPVPPLHHHGLPVQAINLDSAVGGILRSLRLPSFCCSKLISLQPIHSPFGFGKYRLWPLHFAKSSNEIRQSRSLRIPPTTGFRINHTANRLYSSSALSLFRSARSLHGLLKPTFCKRPRMVQPCLGPGVRQRVDCHGLRADGDGACSPRLGPGAGRFVRHLYRYMWIASGWVKQVFLLVQSALHEGEWNDVL